MDQDDDGEPLVPLKAVDEQREAREQERTRAERAERELAEAKGFERGRAAAAPAAAAAAPKEYTAEELQQAVDEQHMTQAQAQAIRDGQSERRIETRVAERADERAEAKDLATRTTAELDRYIEAIPGLADQSSAEFDKVKGEFAYLIGLGHADDKRTELIAVRAAFGDVAKLEKIGQQAARETHQETGGGRDPGAEGTRSDAWPKDMPAKNRKYYDSQINKGVFADRKAAVDEWNYKPKHNTRYAA